MTTTWREGYDIAQVDALLDRVQAALAGYEQGDAADAVTADEVTRARFEPTRRRPGYRQRDIDDFLAEAVVALRRHEKR